MENSNRISDEEGQSYEEWYIVMADGSRVNLVARVTETHWRVFIYPPGAPVGKGDWIGMRQEPILKSDYMQVRNSAVDIVQEMYRRRAGNG